MAGNALAGTSGSLKVLWLTLGLLATACGVAGIVLPLVPATPFLLLAAFAFARSSPRLHGWLVAHPRLGRPIDYDAESLSIAGLPDAARLLNPPYREGWSL